MRGPREHPSRDQVRFRAPVASVVTIDGREALVGGFIDASMTIVDASDAPVVATWQLHQQEIQFRAFGGRLMVGKRHTDIWTRPTAGLDDVVRGRWIPEGFCWHDLDDDLFRKYPFQPRSSEGAWDAFGRNGAGVEITGSFYPEQLDGAVEEVRQQIREAIIVDGQVWVPTVGPVIQYIVPFAANRSIEFVIDQPKPDDRLRTCFSAFDHRIVQGVFQRYRPGFPLYGYLPKVLSREGWSLDATRTRLELPSLVHMAGHQLREAAGAQVPLSAMPREFVAAYRTLRDLEAENEADPGIWRRAVADFAIAAPPEFRKGVRDRLVPYWRMATEAYARIAEETLDHEELADLRI